MTGTIAHGRAFAGLLVLALALALWDRGGGGAALAAAQLPLLLAVAAAAWAGRGRIAPGAGAAPLAALALFWGWLAASVAWSVVPYVSILALLAVGSLPAMALLYALGPDPRRTWRVAAPCLALIAAGLALAGIWQRLALDSPPRSLFFDRHSHTAFLDAVALAVAGACLACGTGRRHRRRCAVLHAIAFFLFLGIAVGVGRGTLLALVVGLVPVLAVGARWTPRRRSLRLLAVVAAAFALANVAVPGSVTSQAVRLGRTVAAPTHEAAPTRGLGSGRGMAPAAAAGRGALEQAGGAGDSARLRQRVLLWSGVGRLVHDAPWHGLGAGVFWLAFPPYRLDAEGTWAQHAHNDLLEVAVELGWPGVVLLLVAAAGAVAALAAVARGRASRARRLEACGLFAGLLALAVHSLFSFNLYVLPTAMLGGLMLGRLAWLAGSSPPAAPDLRAPRPVRVAILGVVALAALEVVGIGWSELQFDRARSALVAGRTAESLGRMRAAARAFPTERPLVNAASIDIAVLSATADADRRRALFADADASLERAVALNPLRPQVHLLRARLLGAAPELAGPDREARIVDALERAVAVDPRNPGVRRALAAALIGAGQPHRAAVVAETGLAQHPRMTPPELPFLALGARLRAERGDLDGARAVLRTMQVIARRFDLDPATLGVSGLGRWLPLLRARGAA